MIRTLLFREIRLVHFTAASVGTLTGIVLLLLTLQLYLDIQKAFDIPQEQQETLVIHKPAATLAVSDVMNTAFSPEEQRALKDHEAVNAAAPFRRNLFEVTAFTGLGDLLPTMSTKLFFESLPDSVLPNTPNNWEWKEAGDTIDILLPRQYLNLYNFGFSQGQGLPQLPPDLVTQIPFRIRLRGAGKSDSFHGRIRGFTDSFNTLLVPESFLRWANATYGSQKEVEATRLLLITPDPTSTTLHDFLESAGYETEQPLFNARRISQIASFLFSVMGLLALGIILLALFIFVLTYQYIIDRSENSIRTLILLGYAPQTLSRFYVRTFTLLFLPICGAALIIVGMVNTVLRPYLEAFTLSTPLIHPTVYILVILLFCTAFLAVRFCVFREVTRIATHS
ncbi:FtsX-like permease family protein [Chitinivibrio alkaliphilus]|uniref:Efflux ABC transporter, permease protein n=1 Tax=Chitinivibrio alkaliphilus ACht1 TaxID=1313304 RepID=U7DDF3_9BACT|nr:hypothetical protein [Chitinivibrio alkaliphilus]ERP38916.1 efflux ABC transporter, permease protein [Chitinivibrio alkaliphilus ACht1]